MPPPSAIPAGGSVQQDLFAAGGALGFYQLGLAADKRHSLKIIMRLGHFPLVLPVIGAAATVTVMWQSMFIVAPLQEAQYMWLIVLLLPFAFAFHMTLKGAKTANRARLITGAWFSVLLSVPAAICFASDLRGESSQLILVFSPFYLWPVVAFMTLGGIAVDALRASKHE